MHVHKKVIRPRYSVMLIFSGVSEIHLKQRFSWEENYITVEVKKSDPVVSYRETVSEESSQMCVSKSPNKQNRLFMKACALPNGLSEDIIQVRHAWISGVGYRPGMHGKKLMKNT